MPERQLLHDVAEVLADGDHEVADYYETAAHVLAAVASYLRHADSTTFREVLGGRWELPMSASASWAAAADLIWKEPGPCPTWGSSREAPDA